jgi:hypothetical protein
MIDDQLLVGIVLIAVGVAIGLLAYALVLNRRESASPATPEGSSELEAEAEIEPERQEEPDETLEPFETEQTEQEEKTMSEALEAEPGETALEEPVMEAAGPSLDEPAVADDTTELAEAVDMSIRGERRAIATLKRDDRTGRLVLVIADREYTNPWDLKGTNDWANVEQASVDLANWLSEARPPGSGPGSRSKKAPPVTKSLVDEVNEILERKLVESGLTHRGVRLSEDREGSVRVYIGIQGYSMDEIPDPDIREVIRQAVEEWEGRK